MPTIKELPQEPFTGDKITNCFYVEDMNTPTIKRIAMTDVVEYILKEAKKEGIAISLIDDIIFLNK